MRMTLVTGLALLQSTLCTSLSERDAADCVLFAAYPTTADRTYESPESMSAYQQYMMEQFIDSAAEEKPELRYVSFLQQALYECYYNFYYEYSYLRVLLHKSLAEIYAAMDIGATRISSAYALSKYLHCFASKCSKNPNVGTLLKETLRGADVTRDPLLNRPAEHGFYVLNGFLQRNAYGVLGDVYQRGKGCNRGDDFALLVLYRAQDKRKGGPTACEAYTQLLELYLRDNAAGEENTDDIAAFLGLLLKCQRLLKFGVVSNFRKAVAESDAEWSEAYDEVIHKHTPWLLAQN
ncbi:hypothetical protein PAPHI01_0539 [Pancytospora philotis]|nr:hypothetical protein PAPHI01_0539 [Pancytospora philotis]